MKSNQYPLPFYKYSGCGNDFILIDDRQKTAPASLCLQICHLCHRRNGIGADGVIVIQKGEGNAIASLVFYNSDGSIAEQCGNGLRCAIRCLHNDLGVKQDRYLVKTPAGICEGRICGEDVEIMLGKSTPLEGPFRSTEAPHFPMYTLKIGVPHAVLICQDIKTIDVETLGKTLRNSPFFAPEGANINFVEVRDEAIAVRTYERGVEAETHACGTGAAASAIASAFHFNSALSSNIQTSGGEYLRTHFQLIGRQAGQIMIRGEARRCFQGLYQLPVIYTQASDSDIDTLRACYAVDSCNFSHLG